MPTETLKSANWREIQAADMRIQTKLSTRASSQARPYDIACVCICKFYIQRSLHLPQGQEIAQFMILQRAEIIIYLPSAAWPDFSCCTIVCTIYLCFVSAQVQSDVRFTFATDNYTCVLSAPYFVLVCLFCSSDLCFVNKLTQYFHVLGNNFPSSRILEKRKLLLYILVFYLKL